jgi:hypothetical protein
MPDRVIAPGTGVGKRLQTVVLALRHGLTPHPLGHRSPATAACLISRIVAGRKRVAAETAGGLEICIASARIPHAAQLARGVWPGRVPETVRFSNSTTRCMDYTYT